MPMLAAALTVLGMVVAVVLLFAGAMSAALLVALVSFGALLVIGWRVASGRGLAAPPRSTERS